MANQNILTYGAAITSIEQLYYSPVATIPPNYNVPLGTSYVFLSRVNPWPNDSTPPIPTQDQQYIKSVFKNIFVAKKVTSNDLCPVISRIDWTANTIYDYYQDNIDMFVKDTDGLPIYQFYVKNTYDQVFKCLWNNNGQSSTQMPYFQPGTYGSDNIFQSSDGYKWKYMYTINSGLKVKFMDSSWIPVPIGANTPNPLITNAGYGDIEVINVTNGGLGYDPSNAIINITVTGDGSGASGTAVVSDGVITDIIVVNTGSNYSYANVSISSTFGSNASAIAFASPIGGHSFDPISELGCRNIMVSVDFNGSEGGYIPTDITYHQLGIVINPTTSQFSPLPANGEIYSTTTDFVVASGFGTYMSGEIIYQGTSLSTAAFSATVLSFDVGDNVLSLINTTGTPVTNSPVFSTISGTTRTLLTYSVPNYTLFSGYMSFIENRSGIQRSSDGIEQFKIVLGY
jgi:hypothetical protein